MGCGGSKESKVGADNKNAWMTPELLAKIAANPLLRLDQRVACELRDIRLVDQPVQAAERLLVHAADGVARRLSFNARGAGTDLLAESARLFGRGGARGCVELNFRRPTPSTRLRNSLVDFHTGSRRSRSRS